VHSLFDATIGFLGNADAIVWMSLNHSETLRALEERLGGKTHIEFVKDGSGGKRAQQVDRPIAYANQLSELLEPNSGTMIITPNGRRSLMVKTPHYFRELAVYHYQPDPNESETILRSLARSVFQLPSAIPKLRSIPGLAPGSASTQFGNDQIEAAISHGQAGFGQGTADRIQPRGDANRIVTPRGTFVNNQDGTVTHTDSGLVFMGGPWGTSYKNGGFSGEPILLTWKDAVRFFGRGSTVSISLGCLTGQNLERSSKRHGYTSGCVRVNFAGHSNWRLPTAIELDLLAMCEEYNYSAEPARQSRKAMFPYYADTDISELWSATGGGGVDWYLPDWWPIGDVTSMPWWPVFEIGRAHV